MRYEKDQREPNMETIEKIANALNIHPMDLLSWEQVTEINEFENFIEYIKSIGYSVFIEQISEDKIIKKNNQIVNIFYKTN